MYRSGFCEVGYLNDLNVVLVTWKQFCQGSNYRKPLLHALSLMRQNAGCNYVADTRSGFENDPEDTKWLQEVFLQRAAETGCEHIFFIIDADERLKTELEGQAVFLAHIFASIIVIA
ncbi:hypothetical protein LJC56_03395 [Christensenellaceae bacterium OttesenSCG-928-K19]|nr:hypothetical protein [Christensenellaceae bacterium OttesenSCG-928-K19]